MQYDMCNYECTTCLKSRQLDLQAIQTWKAAIEDMF